MMLKTDTFFLIKTCDVLLSDIYSNMSTSKMCINEPQFVNVISLLFNFNVLPSNILFTLHVERRSRYSFTDNGQIIYINILFHRNTFVHSRCWNRCSLLHDFVCKHFVSLLQVIFKCLQS